MQIRTIAYKNILRRKSRAATVVVGLAVGIAALVAVVTMMLAFREAIENKLETFGFTMLVQPASTNLSISYGGMAVSGVDTYEVKSLSERDITRIKRIPDAAGLKAIAPVLLQPVTVGKQTALVVGVDFKQEFLVKTWWKLAGRQPTLPGEVIVGYQAAKALGVKQGDALPLAGTYFRITGVLHDTGSQDDNLIFADLHAVQSRFKQDDRLSLIEIATGKNADSEAIGAQIEKAVPHAAVSSIKQAVEYKEKAVGSLAGFGLVVASIIILISMLVVFVTTMSSVRDRKREIGILRAIGYRQAAILKIVGLEVLLLSVAGGALGYGVGFIPVYVLSLIRTGYGVVHFNLPVLIGSLLLAIVVGLGAGIIPARHAACMDPVESLQAL